MIEQSVAHGFRRGIRRHRCDQRFLDLLEADFGISQFNLTAAFLTGVLAPKHQALAVCMWAADKSDDTERRGMMIRGWAKRRKVGAFDPHLS